ncbi:hypothetical protein [Alteromonas sp. a30]|uniref:hypothetical protein n=1 Tax=Alteromonas sp. a30 TaxID=2730917 RepID=UPI00227F98CC|nr:hypothetical protein [Alteromonas sp. a30]MCY7297237.1 hypothetical protein [Alteromonas sp. a30]
MKNKHHFDNQQDDFDENELSVMTSGVGVVNHYMRQIRAKDNQPELHKMRKEESHKRKEKRKEERH